MLLALGVAASTPVHGQGNRPTDVTGNEGRAGVAANRPGGGPPRGDRLVVEFLETEVDYTVEDLSGPPGYQETTGTIQFLVAADMPFVVTALFSNWQPDAPAPAAYLQPAFSNGTFRIGGRLFLEITERGRQTGGNEPGPPSWVGDPGRPAWVGEPGRPDWVDYQGRRWGPGGRGKPGETGRIYQTAEGRIVVDASMGEAFFALGADLAPLFTDAPSGLPVPDTYSVDVEIIIQPY